VGLVDLFGGRGLVVGLGAIVLARLAAGSLGLGRGLALGEGGCLALAGAGRLVESSAEVRRLCDDVVCLLTPEEFWAVGQIYEDFAQVEDEEAVEMLRQFATRPQPRATAKVR
jgi:putative phosphoribosyl transferase